MTKIAFVGTGFVADYYMTTLANHPELILGGVWDRDGERLQRFQTFYDLRAYSGLDEVLTDPEIAIIVNLTTPESHYGINRAALDAGKHVYCEKPLAMSTDEAEALVELAEAAKLTLCAAPANALSAAHEHFAALLAGGRIGRPRLAYAEMEDGPVFQANWQSWKSRSGTPWPGLHEFEVGCTLEHAGYALSWLIALFGPVAHLAAFSALTFPDKVPEMQDIRMAPDFSVGCLTFESGMVARLTCGLAAPRDRSLTVVGDGGTMVARDLWDDRSPVHVASNADGRSFLHKVANRLEHKLGRTLPLRLTAGRTVAYAGSGAAKTLPAYPSRIDFARGIARQAAAINGGKMPFFSGRIALHLTELALALSRGEPDYRPRTSFDFQASWR